MELPPILSNIVGWLRAGYPQGVPEADYIPLLAILTRRLSDEEVQQITGRLVDIGVLPVEKTDIGVMITKVTDEMPLETDVQRVRNRLESGGWPTIGINEPS
ncbi:DUF3349 domain-containing protein [Aldersonia kunmingensis]|uniref:DUF3349 domain-containing protein n=1 Tax=Aldersonia kunmingensis TaxID=408066 RepID=UPI00082B7924|nr:DUF3349 domain-containing protein [Aldersonia kunmingensis]